MKHITSPKTAIHYVHSDAQKTRARFIGVSGIKLNRSSLILRILLTLFLAFAAFVCSVLVAIAYPFEFYFTEVAVWTGIFILSAIIFAIAVYQCWRKEQISKFVYASVLYALTLYLAVNYFNPKESLKVETNY